MNLKILSRYLVPGIALVVTVDQWTAATGDADPWKLGGFSFMAAARGVAIVLAVVFALFKFESLRRTREDVSMGRVIIAMVIGMLVIETGVITPYTMSALGTTGTAATLRTMGGDPLVLAWSVFASGMTLLAVALSAISSLVRERNVGRPTGEKRKYVFKNKKKGKKK